MNHIYEKYYNVGN